MADLERDQVQEEIIAEELQDSLKFLDSLMDVLGDSFVEIQKQIRKKVSIESWRTLENYKTLCSQEKKTDETIVGLENQETADAKDASQYVLAKGFKDLIKKQKENIEKQKLEGVCKEFIEAIVKVVGEVGDNEASKILFNPKVQQIFKDCRFASIPLSKKEEILFNLLAKPTKSELNEEGLSTVRRTADNWRKTFENTAPEAVKTGETIGEN